MTVTLPKPCIYFDDIFGCFSYICKRFHEFWQLLPCLTASRNAAVDACRSLGFKSLTPPTTHAQFDSKVHRAETKFEKVASFPGPAQLSVSIFRSRAGRAWERGYEKGASDRNSRPGN